MAFQDFGRLQRTTLQDKRVRPMVLKENERGAMVKMNNQVRFPGRGAIVCNAKAATSLALRLCFLLVAVTITLSAFERDALAYTDPGTGALIWQMLAAGFVGAAFYFRRFVNWFKAKRSDRNESKKQPTAASANDRKS